MIYCPECESKQEHVIWTEDGYGCEGAARVFSSILSLGTSNLGCTTYAKCLNCGYEDVLY